MRWSREIAYAVGLITTDGCLASDGRHISFTSKDFELVESLRTCLGLRNSIGRKHRGDGILRYHQIQFGDVRLYRWLCSIGLSPRKSLTLGSLRIPDRVFADFVRGHLDGDGSIVTYQDPAFPNSTRLYVRFHSGSRAHVMWLEDKIKQLWSLTGYQAVTTRVFRLTYAKRSSTQLLQHLYYDVDVPCHARKRAAAERFL
jgi:hypothetical protein